jgi:outer membrane autotransporter protein
MSSEAHADRRRARKQRTGTSRSTFAHSAVALAVSMALALLGWPQPVRAQTFDEAATRALREILTAEPNGHGTGPLARFNGNAAQSAFSAAPATGTPQPTAEAAIERRLQAVRESEERRRNSSAAPTMYASNPGDTVLAEDRRLQLPAGTAASSEVTVGMAHGLSLFVSGGASTLHHHKNRFEDGYDELLPTVTIGADYWFTSRLLAGAAFNYTNVDGTYDFGGSFDKDIFSPVLYATFMPFEGAFISATFSYARSENSNVRKVTFVPDPSTPSITGDTSADYSEDLYAARVSAGYDHPLGSFTIGPRLGLAFGYSRVDSFTEKGGTGGELHYSSFDQTSVQSSLGVAATAAIRIPNGVLLPQATVAWVHEYAADERDVQARFVHASPSPTFTFQREPPARNWVTMALGLSASFVNGWQPFVQFVTVQGNKNFVSYGGIAGLRFSF